MLYNIQNEKFQFLQGLIKTDSGESLVVTQPRFNSYKVWLKQ